MRFIEKLPDSPIKQIAVIHAGLLEAEKKPTLMILMVQKEVGQRICATPPEMSILAVSIQFYSIPKIISYVSKKAFWPQPKVDSAIIEIKPKLKIVSHEMFFEILKDFSSFLMKSLIQCFDEEHRKFNTSEMKDIIDICDIILGEIYDLPYDMVDYIQNFEPSIRGGKKISNETEEKIRNLLNNSGNHLHFGQELLLRLLFLSVVALHNTICYLP